MEAVIWTDLIQFVIYILGAIVAGAFLLHLLPGGWQEVATTGRDAGKFRLFDLTQAPDKAYTLWAGVIGGAFFSMASHGADQMMVQRYLCARSLGQARAALVLSGVIVFVQFLLFLLLGVGLFTLKEAGLFTVATELRNDEAFGAFIVWALPGGLVGLVVAAVLAAAMSTLSSSLNSSANATVSDFYRPIVSDRSERHYLTVSRGLTLLWGMAQTAVALIAVQVASNRSVIDQVLSVAGFTTGIVLGLFLLGQARRPVSSTAALVGMVAGFLAVLGLWLPTNWDMTVVAWPWYAPVGALTTVGVALLIDISGIGNGAFVDRGPQSGLDGPR
jgi:Na+/proline symporter